VKEEHKGRYALSVNTARTYGPYFLWPLYSCAFLTPVYTARMFGCRKVHPYIRPVFKGRI